MQAEKFKSYKKQKKEFWNEQIIDFWGGFVSDISSHDIM